MNKINLSICLSFVASLLVFVSVSQAAPTLDGKTFSGEVKATTDKKGDPDTFIFKNGTFRSTACDEYGYTEAPYEASTKGDVTTFTSKTKNKNGATMSWSGKVEKEKISGTAVMTTASGEKTEMEFSGTPTH